MGLRDPLERGDIRFSFPFLTWDAWMALHHIARTPLDLNADGSLPVRWTKPLEERLVPLSALSGIESPPGHRILIALQFLSELKLLDAPNRSGQGQGPSASGKECLKAGRAAFFALSLRSPHLRALDPSANHLTSEARSLLHSLSWRMGRNLADFEGIGRRLSLRLLEVVPPRGAARMAHMEAVFGPSNPAVLQDPQPWMPRTKIDVSTEDFFDRIDEVSARRLMIDALIHPYCLGLFARGSTLDGDVTWSLTPAGRKWLGLAPDPTPDPPRHAKVTPAFDIYFGRVDPSALAEVALYADLTGHDHGVVARLSRSGTQSALSLGIEGAEIVSSLQSMGSSPLPQNVHQTVLDWSRAAQPVRVVHGVVLQCPDAATAISLERLAKGAAERLSDTILVLTDRKTLSSMRKKAHEQGILI